MAPRPPWDLPGPDQVGCGDCSATSDHRESAVERMAERALEVAAASHIASTQKVVLSDVEPHVAQWSSHFEVDPWSVPLEAKIAHLHEATDPLRDDDRIHQQK